MARKPAEPRAGGAERRDRLMKTIEYYDDLVESATDSSQG